VCCWAAPTLCPPPARCLPAHTHGYYMVGRAPERVAAYCLAGSGQQLGHEAGTEMCLYFCGGLQHSPCAGMMDGARLAGLGGRTGLDWM
jgi:hypothetical protein